MTAPLNQPADLETTLAVLRGRRVEVREKFKVELLGVIGSVARGEARQDSDLDVLSIWLPGTTLFKVAEAMGVIEDEVGRTVQLVDSKMLKPDMRRRMDADLVPL